LTPEELEEMVDKLLLKQARGEELTPKEQEILAYSYHAAGCSSCRE
jgi:hypothetical protein